MFCELTQENEVVEEVVSNGLGTFLAAFPLSIRSVITCEVKVAWFVEHQSVLMQDVAKAFAVVSSSAEVRTIASDCLSLPIASLPHLKILETAYAAVAKQHPRVDHCKARGSS